MAALVLPEYYADLAQTTLSSNYTAASGSIVVTTAANLSTTRQFHFMITDQTTGAVKCIGKATALTSSTFTVTMTTDANANSGDFVTITLCAAAMDQIISDCDQFGTYASLPATVPQAGRRYKCTDAPYEMISNGSVWQAFYDGLAATVPPSSGWTSVNLPSWASSVDFSRGYGYMVGNSSVGTSAVCGLYRAAPGSPPYSFIARMRYDDSGLISALETGSVGFATIASPVVGWRDSSGGFLCFFMDNYEGGGTTVTVAVVYATAFGGTFTSPLSQGAGIFAVARRGWISFKIQNDGTNLKFYLSIDAQNWVLLYSETITAHLANAANVFWGGLIYSGGPTVALYDWTQGT